MQILFRDRRKSCFKQSLIAIIVLANCLLSSYSLQRQYEKRMPAHASAPGVTRHHIRQFCRRRLREHWESAIGSWRRSVHKEDCIAISYDEAKSSDQCEGKGMVGSNGPSPSGHTVCSHVITLTGPTSTFWHFINPLGFPANTLKIVLRDMKSTTIESTQNGHRELERVVVTY